MKKPDLTVGDQIDVLEKKALQGRISRRDLLRSLAALGVTATSALSLADHAEAAWANQKARRASLRDEYDYIIVGVGSSGCVLANRLSASGASVLAIEAGSDRIDQPKIDEAIRWIENPFTDTYWSRFTEPQAALDNRSLLAGSGTIWGGSGSICAMICLRGDIRDYARWHQLVGSEWNPAALRRAYLRTETYLPGDRPHRGQHGPLIVSRFSEDYVLTPAYLDAGRELGLREIDNNSGGFLDGVSISEAHVTAEGRRSGPAQGYLVPALARPNLTVLSNTLVNSLVLRGSRCRGVNTVVDGAPRTFRAAREVLLCAGALESPKLLMLSGIGSEEQLAPFRIPLRHKLRAVGQSFHDHVLLYNFLLKARSTLPPPVSNSMGAFAYFRTNPITSAPNIELMCGTMPFFTDALPLGEGFNIVPLLVKPRSRGTVSLTSNDPLQPLKIDPHYLEDPQDLDDMVTALDRCLAVSQTQALRPFTTGLFSQTPLRTREEKVAFIAANGGSGFHQVGTCAAGRNPASSVVDAGFRVWGVDNLRIVDGSVIPEVPAVNTHAPILTLAELAAELMGFAPGYR